METSGYTFRSIKTEGEGNDMEFLRELYASTRREEMSQSGWPQEQIEQFLTQQFGAQHAHYQEHCASSSFDLILSNSAEPIGRLYLDERDTEFRIVDIALLPESRRQGIGGKILREIIDRASKAKKSVTIHVEQNNPAMNLYHRLGFEMIEEQGVYHLMELKPAIS